MEHEKGTSDFKFDLVRSRPRKPRTKQYCSPQFPAGDGWIREGVVMEESGEAQRPDPYRVATEMLRTYSW